MFGRSAARVGTAQEIAIKTTPVIALIMELRRPRRGRIRAEGVVSPVVALRNAIEMMGNGSADVRVRFDSIQVKRFLILISKRVQGCRSEEVN
jgi:hypothetical protein